MSIQEVEIVFGPVRSVCVSVCALTMKNVGSGLIGRGELYPLPIRDAKNEIDSFGEGSMMRQIG